MRPPFLYEVNEMKDLLKLLDLSREEIVRILDVADQMKYDQKHRLPHPCLLYTSSDIMNIYTE